MTVLSLSWLIFAGILFNTEFQSIKAWHSDIPCQFSQKLNIFLNYSSRRNILETKFGSRNILNNRICSLFSQYKQNILIRMRVHQNKLRTPFILKFWQRKNVYPMTEDLTMRVLEWVIKIRGLLFIVHAIIVTMNLPFVMSGDTHIQILAGAN